MNEIEVTLCKNFIIPMEMKKEVEKISFEIGIPEEEVIFVLLCIGLDELQDMMKEGGFTTYKEFDEFAELSKKQPLTYH